MFTKTPIEPNAIYTREETAQLLGISLSTLKQLIRTGQLRVSQPSGLRRVFIRGTSILELMERSERKPITPVRNQSEPTVHEGWQSLDSQPKSLRSKQTTPRARTRAATSKRAARASGGAMR